MDLPTCPACGQSVLDDEAKDCPFCGASMSGKPQARKPTAAVQAAKPAPAAKPETTTPAPKVSEKSTDKDDPFAVDAAAEKKKAIALRPEPSKGRAHEVVCPMCETPGYTSTKAAGRDVYCCNPECLVPVFTAPELPKEEPEPEPVKKGGLFSLTGMGISLLVLAAAAGGLWYFAFRPPELKTIEGTFYVPKSDGATDTATDDATDPQSDTGTPGGTQSSVNDPQTPADIRAASLQAMVKATVRRDNNRSKAYCRRLTATAFAIAGDRAEAQKQMEQLRALRPAIPHYLIEPLVTLAWQSIEAGDESAAGKTLDQAMTVANDLSQRGELRLMFASDLAAALVAVNRMAEAQSLISNDSDRMDERNLAGQLSAMRSTSQYNADAFAAEIPIHGWQAPQAAAVVIALIAHGKNDAAVRWIGSQQDIAVRSEATAVWADYSQWRALSQSKTIDAATIEANSAALPPGGKTKTYARVAARTFRSGSKSDAEAFLAKARNVVPTTAPSEFVLPDMKQLVNFQLPVADSMRMNALAAAELMAAESLAGNSAQSIEACQLAMQYLRGMAPSPIAITKRLNTIADEGPAAIQAELKRILKLKTDNEARLTFNDYRKTCGTIAVASIRRFELQQSVIEGAIDAGLFDYAMQEMTSRAEQTDLNLREPWATTRAAWLLLDRYEQMGNADGAKKINAMLRAAAERRPQIDRMIRNAEAMIAEGRYKDAMSSFDRAAAADVAEEQVNLWKLRLAGRLVAQQKLDGALDFIGAIDNSEAAFRDSALWWISAQATQSGQARAVWETGQKGTMSATEIVSIYGGLIETLEVPLPAQKTAANRIFPSSVAATALIRPNGPQ